MLSKKKRARVVIFLDFIPWLGGGGNCGHWKENKRVRPNGFPKKSSYGQLPIEIEFGRGIDGNLDENLDFAHMGIQRYSTNS